MNQFTSKTQETKFYIKQLLDDKKEHTTAEIKDYVRQKLKDEQVSEGVLAGGIRDLIIEDPLYTSVKRGVYVKKDIDESKYLTNSIKDKLKRVSNEIEKEIKNVDMMKINDNLYMEIRKSQEALEELEMIILRLND